MFSDDLRSARVRIQEENPKKAGSKSYARFERYKAAQTIQGVLDLGGSRADIDWDIDHGYIVLLDRTLAPRKRAESESSESGGEDEQKRDTAARSLGGRKRHKPVSYAEKRTRNESDDEYRPGRRRRKRARGSASSSKAHEPPAPGWLARCSFRATGRPRRGPRLTVNDESSLLPPPPRRRRRRAAQGALRVGGMPLVGRGRQRRRGPSAVAKRSRRPRLSSSTCTRRGRRAHRGGRPLGRSRRAPARRALARVLRRARPDRRADAPFRRRPALARLDLRGRRPASWRQAACSRALEQAAGALRSPSRARRRRRGRVRRRAWPRGWARGACARRPVTRRPTEPMRHPRAAPVNQRSVQPLLDRNRGA